MSIHYCDVCGTRNDVDDARACPYCTGLVLCSLGHLGDHLTKAHPVQPDENALLAGLRATESAERGEVDPAVELVAREAVAEFRPHSHRHHELSDDETAIVLGDSDEIADAVLAALAGRLLPPVVQTREIYGTEEDDFIFEGKVLTDAGQLPFTHIRTITTLADDGSPYGGATLTGKWRNVDE